MINTADYTAVNPSVKAYKYTRAFQTINSSPATFTAANVITNTQRAVYGYSSSSQIVGIQLKLMNVNVECPAASTMNVQAFVAISYDTTDFTWMGTGTYNMVAPLDRILGTGVTTIYKLLTSAGVYLKVNILANYGANTISFVICNSVTGAAITSADYCLYNIEITEYVSSY